MHNKQVARRSCEFQIMPKNSCFVEECSVIMRLQLLNTQEVLSTCSSAFVSGQLPASSLARAAPFCNRGLSYLPNLCRARAYPGGYVLMKYGKSRTGEKYFFHSFSQQMPSKCERNRMPSLSPCWCIISPGESRDCVHLPRQMLLLHTATGQGFLQAQGQGPAPHGAEHAGFHFQSCTTQDPSRSHRSGTESPFPGPPGWEPSLSGGVCSRAWLCFLEKTLFLPWPLPWRMMPFVY